MKTPPSLQKLRGGYYTPERVAEYICDWAIQSTNQKILEPSCGDGVFLVEAVRKMISFPDNGPQTKAELIGIELDPNEGKKAMSNLSEYPKNLYNVVISDFFSFANETIKDGVKFDVIIGNPPFIRNHNFPESQREIAFDIMRAVGLKPSRLTNSWVPFLVASTVLLKNPGKLGMVVPAELLQVGYAAELRKFLVDSFSRISMITFKNLLFQDAQQEVVLLLCEKNGKERNGIRTLEIDDASSLDSIKFDELNESELKPVDHTSEKWTQYFLNAEEICIMREASKRKSIFEFGQLAGVDVGVVTGENSFFVINKQVVKKYNLDNYLTRIVPRSNLIKGVEFTEEDWLLNQKLEKPVHLLNLNGYTYTKLPKKVRDYLNTGLNEKVNEGYKCSRRDPWWSVPSIWIPDAFLLRQNNEHPKLIINKARSTTTDTIHRVKANPGTNINLLTASFYNSLTFAHAEIIGRSYGGGVLELEPSESEKLLVPYDELADLDIEFVDKLIREKGVDELLDYVDQKLLIDLCGFSHKDVQEFRQIWRKLMGRRKTRKIKNSIKTTHSQVLESTGGKLIATS